MISLPNSCKCSTLSVYPKNWRSKNAKVSIDWYITYRFYDPRFPKPKLVMIKGMNSFKGLQDRQRATENILTSETNKLLQQGYNPLLNAKKDILDHENVTLQTSLINALKMASLSIQVAETTKSDIGYLIKSVEKELIKLGWGNMSVSELSRKSTKLLLENISKSSDRFNKNRSYLMILLSELCELEIIQSNFAKDIRKKKTIRKIRQVLTDRERILVNNYLKTKYPEFHRFLHIFFHSGARISELMRIKVSDVDFEGQRFKCEIRKGREYKEVWRTIKDIVTPFWKEVVQNSKQGDYLFSKNLLPGAKRIQPYQVTKRWYRLVKQKLGITADFYSLKHLHTTEVVDLLNEKAAAEHNMHTSTAMVSGVYDVKSSKRKGNMVKKLHNKFA